MQVDQKKQNARKILIIGGAKFSWFFIIFFSIILFFVILSYLRTLSLENNKMETMAVITSHKTSFPVNNRGSVKRLHIKYKVIIDQDEYTHDGMFGRKDLWTTVNSEIYRGTHKGDNIKVYYHKNKPWINEVAEMLDYTKKDSIGSIVVLSILIAIAIFLLMLTKIYRKKWNIA